MNWFLGADLVGVSAESDKKLESDYYLREFEIYAYAPIDQTFDGVLSMAYHKELENDDEHLEVHEAYLKSSKIFNLTQIRLGKFFMGFGRLNRFHRHDWVFTDAPYVQKAFFGNEGAKDVGIEINRNLISMNSRLTVGVTSGNEFNHTIGGHNHGADTGTEAEEKLEKAKAPTAYIRFAKYHEFATTRGLEYGLNYINRMDREAAKYKYTGLDFVFKDRIARYVNWLVQSEVWALQQTHKDLGEEETQYKSGYYIYFEKGFNQNHAFGLRYDSFQTDTHEGEAGHLSAIDGIIVKDKLSLASASYIYRNSEYMRTRFTVDHGQGLYLRDEDSEESFTRAFVQLIFNMGAHPSHAF